MFLGAISDKESTEICTAGLCGISELLNIYHMTGFTYWIIDYIIVAFCMYKNPLTRKSRFHSYPA